MPGTGATADFTPLAGGVAAGTRSSATKVARPPTRNEIACLMWMSPWAINARWWAAVPPRSASGDQIRRGYPHATAQAFRRKRQTDVGVERARQVALDDQGAETAVIGRINRRPSSFRPHDLD